MQSALQSNPEHLHRRRMELQPYLDFFGKEMAYILTIMPAPKRIYHIKTAEWEVVNDPKWQELIDRILKKQREYLAQEFPEFYTQLIEKQ